MSCAKDAVEAVENCVYVKVDVDQEEESIDAVVDASTKHRSLEHAASVGSIQGSLVQKGSPDRGNGASGESLSIHKRSGGGLSVAIASIRA